MKITIGVNVDVEAARNALYISCGGYEDSEKISKMSDMEVVRAALNHCKCWGITGLKENTDAT